DLLFHLTLCIHKTHHTKWLIKKIGWEVSLLYKAVSKPRKVTKKKSSVGFYFSPDTPRRIPDGYNELKRFPSEERP
ncbi:hypothetical protein, partial [Bacillus cereus]|uniref:hypothetical protein n=1 Tax=Bacillus cereus TaxID=1396 RepID=UPI0034D4F0DD